MIASFGIGSRRSAGAQLVSRVRGVDQIVVALFVPAAGAGGISLHPAAVWLAIAAAIAWRYFQQTRLDRHSPFHDARLGQNMAGHRTRIAQLSPDKWHDEKTRLCRVISKPRTRIVDARSAGHRSQRLADPRIGRSGAGFDVWRTFAIENRYRRWRNAARLPRAPPPGFRCLAITGAAVAERVAILSRAAAVRN